MTSIALRFWHRLGLVPRLAISCGAVLACLVLVLLATFARFQMTQYAAGAAQRVDSDLALLAHAISAQVASGETDRVREMLQAFARLPDIDRVVWTDAYGNALGADGQIPEAAAPQWFQAGVGLTRHAASRAVEAGGVAHGQVWLRVNPFTAIDASWRMVLGGAQLMLAGLGAILLLLIFIVWHGLRPLARLSSAVGRFGQGEHGVRVQPSGTAEVSHVIQAFNSMAAQVATLLQTLRDSEAKNRRLAMIVEQSSDSIMTCDLNGTITSWNPGAQRLFGWSAEEAIGTPLRELQFRGISDAAHARLLAHVRSAQTFLGEGARVAKSGATLQVSATHAPLLDDDGRVVGAIAVARDISELKRAQDALLRANEELETRVNKRTAELRGQEKLLRAVIDAMPGVVTFQDPQRRFQWFNRKLEEWLNLPASAIQDKTPAELMRPENARISRPFMDRALGGEAVRFEWSYAREDGGVDELDTSFFPMAAADAGVAGVAAFSMDITPRKRAEAALRETLARSRELAAMVERSNDSIHVRDLDGKVTFWNQGSERLTGFSTAQAMGQPLRSLHLIDKSDAELRQIFQRIRSGTPTDFEGVRRNRDGDAIDVAIRTQPLFDDAGRLSGEVTVMRDISATKQAERDLRHAKEAAEAANRAKSEFLANMSHEIRTPLNGLLGITDLVLDSELTREQRADLELVKVSGGSLMTIINDILDFSKIEAGALRLEAIEFAPADNIADTLRVLGPRAAAKGIELVYDPRELPPLLLGDPGRLRQIVTNLVGNANKFTARGEVCVGVCAQALADGRVLLRVDVRDTGIGIPADKHASIFDAFSQADSSTTRRYGGTGLGLTICAKLARLMGGDIRVESVPGKGSCFSFSARFDAVEIARSAGPASGARVLKGQPVLLIEDNDSYRAALLRLLSGWGMTASEAPHGEAGLALLRRLHDAARPAPLVLLDVMLPGIDGFAVARELQREPHLARSVVVVTGAAQRGDAVRWRDLGVAAFLTKPVQPTELFETLVALTCPREAPASTLITRHSLREARRGESILVAEDNEINQMLARRVLEKLGHTVRIVASGQAALDALLGEAFALVLMDMQMPGMGGLEAAAAIRQREAGGPTRIPIVALTANALVGDREACLASGMDDYLTKPFSAEQLAAVLEHWLPAGAAQASPAAASPTVIGALTGAAPLAIDDGGQLDVAVLEGYVGDDPEAVEEFLRCFLASVAEARTRLASSQGERSAEGIQNVAHPLKSTARTVGAMALGEVCAALEAAAHTLDWAAIDAAMPRLHRQLDRAAADAGAWLAAHSHVDRPA